MLANEIFSWSSPQDEAVNSKTDRLSSTYRVILCELSLREFKSQNTKLRGDEYTVKPGYNDIGLCETSSIAPDMFW